MSRIVYVLNARVPSNNGHVLQTVRMCEGFSAADHDVVLYHADRRQINDELVGADIDDYFGVTQKFETKSLPYIDVNYLHGRISDSLLRPFIIVSHVLFTVLAVAKMYRADADLYITREWPVAYLLVKLGLPTIFEIHKLHGTAFSERGRSAIGSIGTENALRSVVTLTEPTAQGLTELGIPRQKIHIDPDAVDLSAYTDPLSKTTARDEIGIPADEFVVGYTGSLHPGKGAYVLADVCAARRDISVMFVGGSASEVENLTGYLETRSVENAHVVGAVPPTVVPRYQWAADILALPPTAQGGSEKHHPESTSPLKLFEYMAADRPVIATRLPGIEAILDNGENALLVAPDDVDGICAAIDRLKTDASLRRSLTNCAASDVEPYTWEARAKRIVAAANS